MVFASIIKNYKKYEREIFRVFIHYEAKIYSLVSYMTVRSSRPATLLKKRLWHKCFLVNFTKFLRTPFLTEHLWWLLLDNTLNIFLKEFSVVKIEAAIHLRSFLLLSRMFQNNFLFRTLSSSNFCYNRSF